MLKHSPGGERVPNPEVCRVQHTPGLRSAPKALCFLLGAQPWLWEFWRPQGLLTQSTAAEFLCRPCARTSSESCHKPFEFGSKAQRGHSVAKCVSEVLQPAVTPRQFCVQWGKGENVVSHTDLHMKQELCGCLLSRCLWILASWTAGSAWNSVDKA